MMPWIKLDDQFPDHPKIVEVGPLAGWLFIAGLAYCGRYLTDGIIPRGQVRRLADLDDALGLADRLVAANLWEPHEEGYRVHDYLIYNPSAEQVKHDRAIAAKRQQALRDRKTGRFGDERAGTVIQGAPPHHAVTRPVTTTVSHGEVTPRVTASVTTTPSYSRPTPVLEDDLSLSDQANGEGVPGEKPSRAARATRIPNVFPLTDEMREWAQRRVPGLELDYTHDEFCTYWRGEGKTKLDWLQTWQNGMLKAYQRMLQARGGNRPTTPGRAPGRETAQVSNDTLAWLKDRNKPRRDPPEAP